jgi:ABC-2 type transport system permease protein
MVLVSLVVWLFVAAASWEGFHLLRAQNIPLAGGITGMLFDLLFLALLVMLVFSTGIILFGSLFSSAESSFLLILPAPAEEVFAYQLQSALLFSSWAFIILGSPILLAYGIVAGVPWYFYLLVPAFFMGYILIPGCLGAIAALLLANFLPRKQKYFTGAAVVVVIVVIVVWIVQGLFAIRQSTSSRDAVQGLFGQLTFAQSALMPSHWMTRGLLAAARGEFEPAIYNLLLIVMTGLLLYVVGGWCAARLYRRGVDRLKTGGERGPVVARMSWLDRGVWASTFWLDTPTRHLILKDFRTFRRDPVQWGQLLIFAGLVMLYWFSPAQFYQTEQRRPFVHGISLVNLTALATLLCAWMGRFVYPMLSLEGRKFWILGLLPLDRRRLIWGKFHFAAIGAVVMAEVFVLISDVLLQLPLAGMVLHALCVAALGFGLSGLTVGLSAMLPNFRENDPSKIAVGLGGTLTLIVGLLYLGLIILLMAAPYHLAFVVLGDADREPALNPWVIVGVVVGIGSAVAAVVLPLRWGTRALERMEF